MKVEIAIEETFLRKARGGVSRRGESRLEEVAETKKRFGRGRKEHAGVPLGQRSCVTVVKSPKNFRGLTRTGGGKVAVLEKAVLPARQRLLCQKRSPRVGMVL